MRRHPVDMRALFGSLLCWSSLGFVTGCGSTDEPTNASGAPKPGYTRVGRTGGGPIVATRDERVAVATNRLTGVVTVFHLDPGRPPTELITQTIELEFDKLEDRAQTQRGSEPWAAVLGKDDDTAYVIARQDSRVVRIVNLHETPKVDGWVSVGSEPTSIVISPSGNRLFIANWGEGTISVVGTPDFSVRQIDLNETIAAATFGPDSNSPRALGSVEPRPGLAHPRALALTDNGDDKDDETLYATEFFSLPGGKGRAGPVDPLETEATRRGLVYRIPLGTGAERSTIPILPVWDTGFVDSNGSTTQCFPNQLNAAAVEGNRLYVTSMCASPRGPLGAVKQWDGTNNTANFKTLMHPVVFVINTLSGMEVPEERRILTQEVEQLNSTSPNAVPRMPLIPSDLVFASASEGGRREAFLTAFGADAVFRLGDPGTIGFIDVASSPGGHLPIGTAVLEKASLALVLNDNSQNMSVVDLGSNEVKWAETTIPTKEPAKVTRNSKANSGHLLFATGNDVWSFKGQAWGSCEGCHPDGLSDGVTWFFARGPRRTLSTAGTYDEAGNRRVMLWTGNIDEVHDIEAIVRGVTGGVGGVLWKYVSENSTNDHRILYDGSPAPAGPDKAKPTSTLRNGLNGSLTELLDINNGALCTGDSTVCDRSQSTQWNDIDAFIRSVRTPNRPTNLSDSQVAHGASLFGEGRCAGCHAGPSWTISHVLGEPGNGDNGKLPYSVPAPNPDGSMPALEVGRLRSESYVVVPALQQLNPVSLPDGFAPFRSWNPAGRSPALYLYGSELRDGYDASKKTHGNDQINCVLRAVGTFPDQSAAANTKGIVASGAPPVLEVRQDMTTLALGATGFNIPSLLGLATAGSYFHAGNARTLEEAFDVTFDAHLRSLKSDFLSDANTRASDVADLVAYLLSIDDEELPARGPGMTAELGSELDLCAGPGVVRPPPAPACTAGSQRCVGDRSIQTCDATGNWGMGVFCNAGETCTSCSGTPACAPFPAPVRMDDIDLDGYADEDLTLSEDELTAFFVSDRIRADGGLVGPWVWTASRPDKGTPFTVGEPVSDVAAPNITSFALTSDLFTLFAVVPATPRILIQTARTAVTNPFNGGTMSSPDAEDPWINGGATRLYYEAGGLLYVADLNGGTIGEPRALWYNPSPNDGSSPLLTRDELTLYFARSTSTAGLDVSIARRASTADPFGTPGPLAPGVSSNDDDMPDWISADGCRLYLHRRPAGGTSDIYLSEKK